MDIVPLTAEHMDRAWGRQPPVTCHGFAVVEGEQLLGIAAIYPDEANRRLVLVSHLPAETRALFDQHRWRRGLVLASRRAMELAKRWKAPVHCVADPEVPGSRALLKHMGFTHYREDTYAWPGSQ